jgi:hypothetical protein
MHGRLKILDHGREIALQSCPAADDHIIARQWQRHDIGPPHYLAQPAAHTVSFGGGADLLADSKSDAGWTSVVAQARLHDKGRPRNTRALSGGKKIRAFFQPVHDVNRRIGIAG